ncbi:ABC transporter ATP-binding protein [Erythrobacter alti]|uniref:ABC transporter ATP-binding protein n=1 Tax=Erythrobacter alti TaxID=1896145 RepID=UPI0030F3AACA
MPPDEHARKRSGARDLFRAIFAYAGPRMGRTLFIVALAAVLEGVGLVLLLPVAETLFAQDETVQAGVTGQLLAGLSSIGIDTVIGQLATMGLGFVLLVALRAYVLMKRDIMMTALAQGFVDHTRQQFFTLLAHTDWPVIKRFRKSQLLNTMTTNIGRLAMTMQALSNGLVTLAMGLAYLIAAFVVSAVLGLALLVLVAIGLVSAIAWMRRSHRLGSRLNFANRGVMHETTLFLDGMKAAKAARAEDELSTRFAQRIAETRALAVEFVMQQSRLRNTIQLVGAVAALLVLLVGYGLVGLTGGELLVMAAIVLRLSPNLISTFSGLQSIAHALPSFEAIRETEAELKSAQQGRSDNPLNPDDPLPPADEALLIERACVDVVNDEGEIVRLVSTDNVRIAPGTLVHVGGPSGAGKSSLVELIAGLHLPAEGAIRRGDFLLQAGERRAWQSEVSFAPQEPFIFDGSVRENLLWPNLSADDAAVWHALEQAEASEIVRDLPGGLDEDLLDGGARLSGGERQRLCLARALLRPASLLILDEATSAMDPDLERRVIGRLRENIANRIILMVSHSLNAVGYADMRIDVAQGRARVMDAAEQA